MDIDRFRRMAGLELAPGVLAMAQMLMVFPGQALAGGPKYVAGASFFDPGVMGQPLHWAGGQVSYYVDQGR